MARKLFADSRGLPSVPAFIGATACLTFVVVLGLEWARAALYPGVPTIAGSSLTALLAALVTAPLVYLLLMRPFRRPRASTATAGSDSSVIVDPVTHTLNRRGITATLLEGMAQSQRYATPLCVALLAIDDFEALADRHGAGVCDQAVQWAAGTMTEALRLPDRLGRYEEGRFLLVMPQTRAAAGVKVAERLREAVAAAPRILDQGPEPLALSVGVVEFGKGHDLEKLLSHAQAALAEAQRAGGNQVVRAKATRRRKDRPPAD